MFTRLFIDEKKGFFFRYGNELVFNYIALISLLLIINPSSILSIKKKTTKEKIFSLKRPVKCNINLIDVLKMMKIVRHTQLFTFHHHAKNNLI